MRIACAIFRREAGWFRIFGYGLHWKDTRRVPPLFSERCGYSKRLHLGPIWIGVLKP